MTLATFASPAPWSWWDLPPVRAALSLIPTNAPISPLICLAAAVWFGYRGVVYLRRLRAADSGSTPLWTKAGMAICFTLSAAWLVLIALELGDRP